MDIHLLLDDVRRDTNLLFCCHTQFQDQDHTKDTTPIPFWNLYVVWRKLRFLGARQLNTDCAPVQIVLTAQQCLPCFKTVRKVCYFYISFACFKTPGAPEENKQCYNCCSFFEASGKFGEFKLQQWKVGLVVGAVTLASSQGGKVLKYTNICFADFVCLSSIFVCLKWRRIR